MNYQTLTGSAITLGTAKAAGGKITATPAELPQNVQGGMLTNFAVEETIDANGLFTLHLIQTARVKLVAKDANGNQFYTGTIHITDDASLDISAYLAPVPPAVLLNTYVTAEQSALAAAQYAQIASDAAEGVITAVNETAAAIEASILASNGITDSINAAVSAAQATILEGEAVAASANEASNSAISAAASATSASESATAAIASASSAASSATTATTKAGEADAFSVAAATSASTATTKATAAANSAINAATSASTSATRASEAAGSASTASSAATTATSKASEASSSASSAASSSTSASLSASTATTKAAEASASATSAAASLTDINTGLASKAPINNPVFTGTVSCSNGFSVGNSENSSPTVLDWYEEGTWTPTFVVSTPGDLAFTYSSQLGHYTRIGRSVRIDFYLSIASVSYTTATGAISFGGLPFITGGFSTISPMGSGVIATPSLFTKTGYSYINTRSTQNSSTCHFRLSSISGGGAQVQLQIIDFATSTPTLTVSGSLEYHI